MKKRALITGVAGQDGTYLTELLLGKGYEVWGIIGPAPGELFESWRAGLPSTSFVAVEADMTDEGSLDAAVSAARPDEVYNFAAVSSVGDSWKQLELVNDVNVGGVERLLHAVERFAPKARLCQASTAEIFGQPASSPQDESTPIAPVNPYGESKAAAFELVARARTERGMHANNAILYNHESPMRPPTFVTAKIARAAARIAAGLESEVRLGNLEARRDWGFAGDYVEAMWRMLQQEMPDDYVVASGEARSVFDFCDAAFSRVGLDCRDHVVVDPEFFRPVDATELVGDSSKARRVLGWEPTKQFVEVVAMMVDVWVERTAAELAAAGEPNSAVRVEEPRADA